MSPLPGAATTPEARFPRVSGDEPGIGVQVVARGWFSPRERG